MNSKHTPGPWACLTPRTAFTNRCCPIEADGVEIAKVWCDGDEFPEHVGEANARLIIKAVNNHERLLECLRGLLEIENDVCEHNGDYLGNLSEICETARALIAEIEGGEV